MKRLFTNFDYVKDLVKIHVGNSVNVVSKQDWAVNSILIGCNIYLRNSNE